MGTLKKGLLHLYTGEGKGKTTAAFGLALRAAGAGLKVCVFQFLKGIGPESSEVRLGRRTIPNIKIVRFRQSHPFFAKQLIEKTSSIPKAKDKKEKNLADLKYFIARAVGQVACTISSGEYDLVVLDEIVNVVRQQLVNVDEVLDLIRNKPATVELVLTGRGAPKKLIEACDYVTEMKLVKHPFQEGIKCRKGIEF